jgi:hypothetical protein
MVDLKPRSRFDRGSTLCYAPILLFLEFHPATPFLKQIATERNLELLHETDQDDERARQRTRIQHCSKSRSDCRIIL